jgi:hypothetical protein
MANRLKYVVSADFGQTTDYTPVAVTRRRLVLTSEKYLATDWRLEGTIYHPERVEYQEIRQECEQHYDLLRLDRVALRTPYTTIAKGIVKLVKELHRIQKEERPESGNPHDRGNPATPVDIGLAIDEGGVGKAVKDILVETIEDDITYGEPHILFFPVTVHGGANTTISGGYYHVPKRDLVHAGIVAFQNGQLHVGKLRYRGVLEEELKNYRLKQNLATGYTAFEPLREGQHDDLLFATCLGVWAWERGIRKVEHLSFPGEWPGSLQGIPTTVAY